MYFRVNDFEVGVNDSIFSEQEKLKSYPKSYLLKFYMDRVKAVQSHDGCESYQVTPGFCVSDCE